MTDEHSFFAKALQLHGECNVLVSLCTNQVKALESVLCDLISDYRLDTTRSHSKLASAIKYCTKHSQMQHPFQSLLHILHEALAAQGIVPGSSSI